MLGLIGHVFSRRGPLRPRAACHFAANSAGVGNLPSCFGSHPLPECTDWARRQMGESSGHTTNLVAMRPFELDRVSACPGSSQGCRPDSREVAACPLAIPSRSSGTGPILAAGDRPA